MLKLSPVSRLAGAILAVAALLAACVPTSEHPILVPGAPTVDPDILGTWRGEVGEQDSILIILDSREEADAGGMTLLLAAPAAPHEDSDPGWIYALALAAKVGDQRYLSIEWRSDGGKAVERDMRGYHLYRYEIEEDGEMHLYGASEAELTALHEQGKLEGTVSGSGVTRDLRITASSETLVKLLGEVDPEVVFSDLAGKLARLK